MSLDIYLISKESITKPASSGIFVRKNGQTIEISEEEWNKEYPDKEPVKFISEEQETNQVFHHNITHNLNKMASKGSSLYQALWRPEELGFTQAKQLIPVLALNLTLLQQFPERFKQYNPENNWGRYEGLLECVSKYLEACLDYPEATIEVDR